MHSSTELSSSSFALTIHGRPAELTDLLSGFDDRDRLGVVVREQCGAVGASGVILAAVTRFFDCQRQRSKDFFIYPDYFVFHVNRRLGDHNMLDIWPDHKEVIVDDDAETLVRAINDRGITRLLVPDGTPEVLEVERQTRASAESRIITALAYSPDGQVRDADVTVQGNETTESYVSDVLDQSTGTPEAMRAQIRAARRQRAADGSPTEQYRRITLEEALSLLAGWNASGRS